MENMELGFELMLVGMSTVFVVLLIVIWGGKLLIKAVNKIAPEETAVAKKPVPTQAAVDAPTMAILQQAVSQITGGKGKVASARKL